MAKPKKAKERPEKYAEKVRIDLTPDEAMKQLANLANKKVKEKLPPPTTLEEKVDEINKKR